MSLMTRAVSALAVLTVAAIPVAALTINTTSSRDVSVAMKHGAAAEARQIPVGDIAGVNETRSRLLPQTDTLEDDGALVTADATPTQRLIPQGPITGSVDAAETTAEKPAYKPRRTAGKLRRHAQKGPAAGSFEMLMQGPAKK